MTADNLSVGSISRVLETFKIESQHQEDVYVSWMCKKQTTMSHNSTESEVISGDAGLRMDGIPALDVGCGDRSFWKQKRVQGGSRKLRPHV